jgi:hypothetical protein
MQQLKNGASLVVYGSKQIEWILPVKMLDGFKNT